jgi:4-diphosphocytidyl-2-C-methyl-D-erythritol kinase
MIDILSPAKINLSLKVMGKRSDGYHNLEMTLSQISIYDSIKIIKRKDKKIIVKSTPFGPQGEENLAFKAAKYFFYKTKLEGGVSIEIKKTIPIGSGLGGGSSNAAHVIIGLGKLFENQIKPYDFNEIAYKLGADVPFFLTSQTSFLQEIGNVLTPTPLKSPLYLVVISPDFSFSTKEIFSEFDKHSNNLELTQNHANDNNLKNLKVLPCSAKDSYFFRNDLQDVASLINKKIGDLISLLIKHGALKALMTGSGSSVYGIFENHVKQGEAFNSLNKMLKLKEKKDLMSGNNYRLFIAQTLD